MASWSTHQLSMSTVRACRLSYRLSGSRTCSSRPCSPLPAGSANRNDFALVAMLGLLGLRIFEATGADIGDLGEAHGHRVLRVCGKGGKIVLVPLPPAVARASTAPSTAAAPGRS